MSKSHWCQATFPTREGIHYSRTGICNSAKTYRINKGENVNTLCLQAFNLAKSGSPAFGNSLFDHCRHSPGRKNIIVSFTTKYAVPCRLKPRILELPVSIRGKQSNLSIVFIFVSWEEKDCSCVLSVGQPGLTATRTASTVTVRCRANHFFTVFFFYFWVGRYNKTLNDWLLGKEWAPFPQDLQCSLRVRLREHWGSRGNKTYCFPWGQSLSA